MDKNCTSALIAEKTIEALYGKVSVESSYDEDDKYYEWREWDFSSCDLDINTIEEREEILQNLDRDTVKTELQDRYDSLWRACDIPCLNHTELNEIVMWTQNGFITYH